MSNKIEIISDACGYKKGEIVSSHKRSDGNYTVKCRDKMLSSMGFNTMILAKQCKEINK